MPGKNIHNWPTPFVSVLVMIALSIVGIASTPRLNVQYTPTESGRSISVSYYYADASAEAVEAEVTSVLEGALSVLSGITDISSVSRNGSGSITIIFRKGTDMDAARFEVSSTVRNIYSSMPEGFSFPDITFSSGESNKTDISYIFKGALPTQEIEQYVREQVLVPISTLRDVEGVTLSGATPYHWVITINSPLALSAGVSMTDVVRAFNSRYSNILVGMTETSDGKISVRLAGETGEDFGDIPIKKVGDRIYYFRDFAVWRYEEAPPRSYYRVNGLNTITMAVSTTEDSNLLSAVRSVKDEMERLQTSFPDEISASIVYDSSEYVTENLRKIYFRTILCVLILLFFVFLVSRSWRYLLVITATLIVNVLVALSIYAFLGLQIHIYTLAGITVSLSIIIDSSVMMADHYGRWKNRRIFPALFSAIATTVGALLTVLLLPENARANLTDFIWVIVINLSLSLVVAYIFIPSLMSFLPMEQSFSTERSFRNRRRLAKVSAFYRSLTDWCIGHRWVLILVFIISFGIPVCLIPGAQNRSLGSKILSSSFGLFYRSLEHSSFFRQPAREKLYIRAGMAEGCTVNQLNDVVRSMENFLAGYEEIDVFTTSINSYDNASIVVEFKPEYEKTYFPIMLKSQVVSMAINLGGATWSVYGMDDNYFNNNIMSAYKGCHILLTGYNYNQLKDYAEILSEYLSSNRRVNGLEIWSSRWSGTPRTEFNLSYDFETMTAAGINPYRYYGELSSRLFDRRAGALLTESGLTEVLIRSSETERYDLWHVLNQPIPVDSLKITLSSVGSIVKRRSGMDIRKSNQSYQLDVCYDFMGSAELSKRVMNDALEYMNSSILPLGFKAENPDADWFDSHKDNFAWLILLIVVVIFVLLAISLESFKLPLSVIFMIPVSFIGVFLIFGLTRFPFDQGGFASFVMLCGIVVNAGIYLLTTYQHLGGPEEKTRDRRIRCYVNAFKRKIVPILITIISTILGLIPFLSDGPEEVFWFDFAVGTICGIVFSIIALLLFLPAFAIRR